MLASTRLDEDMKLRLFASLDVTKKVDEPQTSPVGPAPTASCTGLRASQDHSDPLRPPWLYYVLLRGAHTRPHALISHMHASETLHTEHTTVLTRLSGGTRRPPRTYVTAPTAPARHSHAHSRVSRGSGGRRTRLGGSRRAIRAASSLLDFGAQTAGTLPGVSMPSSVQRR